MTVTAMPAHLMRRGQPDALGKELLAIITDAIVNQPRSLQTKIGPSEVGHPCARRIGYKLLNAPHVNRGQGVPWKPFVGTAVHAQLEDVFGTYDHTRAIASPAGYEPRWLTEMKVDVGVLGGGPDDVIEGSCDLYDRMTATVIDWKVVGPAPLKSYRASGPGQQYRSQAHLYGRGWGRRGLPVDTVMIVFLPRNDELHGTYVWHERYDEQVAIDALNRATGIKAVIDAFGNRSMHLLPTADAWCFRCPYYRSGSIDLSSGCPGDPGAARSHTPALGMAGAPTQRRNVA